MSNMSEFLAGIYGTNADPAPTHDNEIEKLAQAELLDGLLQKEAGVSLDSLTVDEVIKVAAEAFGEESPLVQELLKEAAGDMPPSFVENMKEMKKEEGKADKPKEEEEEEGSEKEASEAELLKMAQNADTSGRIMAHSFWQELNSIKEAAEKEEKMEAKEEKKDEKMEEKKASFSVIDALARARVEEASQGREKRASFEDAVARRAREIAAERGIDL